MHHAQEGVRAPLGSEHMGVIVSKGGGSECGVCNRGQAVGSGAAGMPLSRMQLPLILALGMTLLLSMLTTV